MNFKPILYLFLGNMDGSSYTCQGNENRVLLKCKENVKVKVKRIFNYKMFKEFTSSISTIKSILYKDYTKVILY